MKSNILVNVRYAETDKMGIAHHSNYAVWYEACKMQLLKDIGIDYNQWEMNNIFLPVMELIIKYKKPAYFNQLIWVETYLSSISIARLKFKHRVFSDDSIEISSGITVHGIVDENMHPIDLSAKYPVHYNQLCAAIIR